jgi:hypothetical protein
MMMLTMVVMSEAGCLGVIFFVSCCVTAPSDAHSSMLHFLDQSSTGYEEEDQATAALATAALATAVTVATEGVGMVVVCSSRGWHHL